MEQHFKVSVWIDTSWHHILSLCIDDSHSLWNLELRSRSNESIFADNVINLFLSLFLKYSLDKSIFNVNISIEYLIAINDFSVFNVDFVWIRHFFGVKKSTSVSWLGFLFLYELLSVGMQCYLDEGESLVVGLF